MSGSTVRLALAIGHSFMPTFEDSWGIKWLSS